MQDELFRASILIVFVRVSRSVCVYVFAVPCSRLIVVVVAFSLVVNNEPRSELKLMLLNYLIAVVLVRLGVYALLFFFLAIRSFVYFVRFLVCSFSLDALNDFCVMRVYIFLSHVALCSQCVYIVRVVFISSLLLTHFFFGLDMVVSCSYYIAPKLRANSEHAEKGERIKMRESSEREREQANGRMNDGAHAYTAYGRIFKCNDDDDDDNKNHRNERVRERGRDDYKRNI